jgi:fructokinase
MDDERLFGGIELGGTKSIAVVARGRTIVHEARWPTAAPDATLGAISAWMANATQDEPIAALGLASFGPLGLIPGRADFGRIVDTPKVGWSGCDVRGQFASRFPRPHRL